MSKKKRQLRQRSAVSADVTQSIAIEHEANKRIDYSSQLTAKPNGLGLLRYLKSHWWAVALIAFLSLGVIGAGLKYLEEDSRLQMQSGNLKTESSRNQSLLNSVNPFLPAPLPNPTPQLSKEYIYAGDRLLAVEDANATAAPPADLAVWRRDMTNNTGTWMVMGGQGSQQTFFAWGNASDKPVPGDFDGDGKTDFSVFRLSESKWYVVKSSSSVGEWFAIPFGTTDDVPAPADYDGDGKTDIAVFRPSNGTWYFLRSSDGGFSYQQFGLSTDKLAPADYDGDGRADFAVWREGTPANFYVLRSSNNQFQAVQLGQTGDTPVSADYDGDGRADHAVKSGANWKFFYSSTGQTGTIPWEQSTDQPVQNDYDGDGKVDIAVWIDSNGDWYIRNSSTGQLRQVHWGQSGDIPVPAFYRR